MDSNRDNRQPAGQDSDDLIAELARLVAKDARSTSSKSEAYVREEPKLDAQPIADQPRESALDEPRGAAMPPAPEDGAAGHDTFSDLDYGAARTNNTPSSEMDPIAGLIADAEVDSYARDFEADAFEEQARADKSPSGQYNPSPVQQIAREDDPLSEIEALIGEAAKVNADDPGSPGRRVKSSFLDDRETSSGAVDAAESAILAAAAATGTPVRHVEPQQFKPTDSETLETEYGGAPSAPESEAYSEPVFDDPATQRSGPYPYASVDEAVEEDFDGPKREPVAKRPRRSPIRTGGFILPIAAGALIFALIGSAYVFFLSGPPEPGEAPILTADASPVKEEAEPPAETSGSDSAVFNEIEGNAETGDEVLVSRDQTGGVTGSEVANVVSYQEDEAVLVNRPVRTVTVRPDGTIVQAGDSVAGSNVLPVDRPNVPDVPNSTLSSDPIGQAITEAMSGEASDEANDAEIFTTAALEADTETLAATGGTEPTTALPIPRPDDAEPSTESASSPEVAAADETAPEATETTPTQSSSEPSAWVQLSSQRTEEVARAGIAELQARYGSLFNGATPEVSRVDLEERGIYYRVRLPQPSLADANAVCSAIQGQGGDCFVLGN